MERRVLLAILLSFVVLYAYQALVVKPKPADTPATAGSTATTSAPVPAAPGQPATTTSSPPPTAASQAQPSGATPVVAEPAEHDVRVETPNVVAVFTNRGARLKSWRLKHYLDGQKQPQELVVPLPGQPLPFTLKTPDDATSATINQSLYAVSGAPDGVVTSPTDVTFAYRDSAGLDVSKVFRFEAESYLLSVRTTVTSGGRAVPASIQWGPAVGDTGPGSSYAQKAEGLVSQGGKPQRIAAKDIAKQNTYEGSYGYAGVDDNYFMTVALPGSAVKVVYQPVSVPGATPKDPTHDFVAYTIEPSDPASTVRFFVGPKDFDVLSRVGADLPQAINFGMFRVIVVPLLQSLKWVNGFVHNYGLSIVILTVIINLILFPLQHKSIVSMRKMQEIQPQVKAIQDRYAKIKTTDPEKQKMNQELMALYRDRGVNPASGCVPIVLTMPLLFAMWAMLSTSIELRGVSFLWLPDLTQRDPIYLTPILMGATQFWQQMITPAAGADPAQQKMMMVMPVVMTVMFITLPAGALIYYTVSGLLRIGQQYVTNSIIGPPTVRTPRPPAERRLKRAGAGKTEAASEKG